ncbi:cysteine hydrolase family protein [Acidiphilium iwatense]|uniref:Cysteine hydrolase n=1 Tax=Acidiphilium iwatense TaxID=768198 RepID=A0ABS9DXP0_9PROT|nr:cysteine hydrolase family protein [Acidiphilium iwatense]MCF3946094.1 cysteine hydrolase [Acidiphilium iwatense]
MDALLVIDVQCGMFADPAVQPHEGEAVVGRIARLIDAARTAKVPVIFVQHDGGAGDVLARGEPGFAFRPELAPRDGEPVVVKRFCSAFQETDLADLLAAWGIGRVAVCGMQTEYCIDTTCRSAFERGLEVTLIGDAHTTFDSDAMPAAAIIRHHNATLNGGFVAVRQAEAVRFGD